MLSLPGITIRGRLRMLKLEDIKKDLHLVGVELNRVVRVLATDWGDLESLSFVYRCDERTLGDRARRRRSKVAILVLVLLIKSFNILSPSTMCKSKSLSKSKPKAQKEAA